jgi:hypothetical protein
MVTYAHHQQGKGLREQPRLGVEPGRTVLATSPKPSTPPMMAVDVKVRRVHWIVARSDAVCADCPDHAMLDHERRQ